MYYDVISQPDVLDCEGDLSVVPADGVVGTIAQSFHFDGLSRMVFSRDAAGTANADASFIFDSISRVLEEQQTYASYARYVTKNACTGYPATGFTFPDNRQITIDFDALYRKIEVDETSGGSHIAIWKFFGYRTATVTLGNGIVTSSMNNALNRSAIQYGQTTPGWGSISTDQLGYDGAGRPIGKRHFSGSSVLVGFTSGYDLSSNKLFERPLHAESRASLYASSTTYIDSMNRLLDYQRGTLASGGGSVSSAIALPGTNQEQDYNLDAVGNWSTTTITPEGGTASTQSRSHNLLNQITAYGVSPTSTPVLYDQGNNSGTPPQKGNGNIIDDGVRTMAYDALNRLTTVSRKSDGLQIAAYVYDALGRRIQKTVSHGGLSTTVPNGTTRYLYDGWRIVEELVSASTTIQYVWGQYVDELIQLKALTTIGPQPLTAGSYYLLSDLLYRSAALTNGSSGVVEAYDTDAYGNTLLFSGPGTDGLWFTNDDVQAAYPACRYVFAGREYDAETQVYFYRARYFEPAFGRFSSREPGARADANLYEFLSGNPASLMDPSGRSPIIGLTPPPGPPAFSGSVTNPSAAGTYVPNPGTVNVYTGASFVTPTSGAVSNAIVIDFVGANCAKCHWLQLKSRNRYTANTVGGVTTLTPNNLTSHSLLGFRLGVGGGNPDIYHSNGLTYTYGITYVDSDGTTPSPFYDAVGASIVGPSKAEIGDAPTPIGDEIFSADDFLVCDGQFLYHVHWERWGKDLTGTGTSAYRNVRGNMPLGFPSGKPLIGGYTNNTPKVYADPRIWSM